MKTYTFGPWQFGLDTSVNLPAKPEESAFLEISNFYMGTDGYPIVRPCLKDVLVYSSSTADGVVDHPTKGICFFTDGVATSNTIHFDTPDNCGQTTIDGASFANYSFEIVDSGVVNGVVWAYIKHGHQSLEIPYIYKMHVFDGRNPTYSFDAFVPNSLKFDYTPSSIIKLTSAAEYTTSYEYSTVAPQVEQIASDVFISLHNQVAKSAIAAPAIYDYRTIDQIEQDGILRYMLIPSVNAIGPSDPVYIAREYAKWVTFTTDINWNDIDTGVDVTDKYNYVFEVFRANDANTAFERWSKIDPTLISFVENNDKLSVKLAIYRRLGWSIDPNNFTVTAGLATYPGATAIENATSGTAIAINDIFRLEGSTIDSPSWRVTAISPLTLVVDSAGDSFVQQTPQITLSGPFWTMKSTNGNCIHFLNIPYDDTPVYNNDPYFLDGDVVRLRLMLKPEIEVVSGFQLYPSKFTIDSDGNSSRYNLPIAYNEATTYKVFVNDKQLTSDYYSITEQSNVARIQFTSLIAYGKGGYRIQPPTVIDGGSDYNDGDIIEMSLPVFDIAQPRFRVITNKTVVKCEVSQSMSQYGPGTLLPSAIPIGTVVVINGLTLTCVDNFIYTILEGDPPFPIYTPYGGKFTTSDVIATTALSESVVVNGIIYDFVYSDTNEVGAVDIVAPGLGSSGFLIAPTVDTNVVTAKKSTATGAQLNLVATSNNDEVYTGIKQSVYNDADFNKYVFFDGVNKVTPTDWTPVFYGGYLYLKVLTATKPTEIVTFISPLVSNDIVFDPGGQLVSAGSIRYEDKTYVIDNTLSSIGSSKEFICVVGQLTQRINSSTRKYFTSYVEKFTLGAFDKSDLQHKSYLTRIIAKVVNGVAVPYKYPHELNTEWYATKHLENLTKYNRSSEAGFFVPDNTLGVVTSMLALKDKLLITSSTKSALYTYSANISQISKLDEYQFGTVDPVVAIGSTAVLNTQHGFKSIALGGLNFDGISSSDIGERVRELPIELTTAVYWPAINCYIAYGDFVGNDTYATRARLPESMIRSNSKGFVCYTATPTISSWSTWYLSSNEIRNVTGDTRTYLIEKLFVGNDPTKLYVYLKSYGTYPAVRVICFDVSESIPSYSVEAMYTIAWTNLGNKLGSNRLHYLDASLEGEPCKISIGTNSYSENDFLDEIVVEGSTYDTPRIGICGDARLVSIHGKLDADTWVLRESNTLKFTLKSLQLAYTALTR